MTDVLNRYAITRDWVEKAETIRACYGHSDITDSLTVSLRLDKVESIQQALALALETLSEQTAPEHPVWAEIERLLGGKIEERSSGRTTVQTP